MTPHWGAINRRWAPVALAGVLLAGAGLYWQADRPHRTAAHTSAGWQTLPGAFPVKYSWRTGPEVLVADPNGCYAGFGADTTGYGLTPGYWQATGDCTRPVPVGPRPGPPPEGPPSSNDVNLVDAVAAPGGGYLALGLIHYHNDYFGYEGFAVRGDPATGWSRVAAFETTTGDSRTSHVGPTALAVSNGRFVAVGQRNGTPTVWTSADGGTWTEAPLPATAGPSAVTGVAAGPDGRLVAIGTGNGRPYVWLSADSGATWQPATLPPATGTSPAQLTKVVHSGSSFLAVGGASGDQDSAAVVLRSSDGLTWTADDRPAAAGAKMLRAVAALPDGSVLASAGSDTPNEPGDPECGRVWRFTDNTWTADDLGCQGVPTTFVALADGRVAAASGTTLFLRARP